MQQPPTAGPATHRSVGECTVLNSQPQSIPMATDLSPIAGPTRLRSLAAEPQHDSSNQARRVPGARPSIISSPIDSATIDAAFGEEQAQASRRSLERAGAATDAVSHAAGSAEHLRDRSIAMQKDAECFRSSLTATTSSQLKVFTTPITFPSPLMLSILDRFTLRNLGFDTFVSCIRFRYEISG